MDTSKAAGAGESHGAKASDPVALAKAHKAKGYRAAYAPRVSLRDTDRIREIRRAFEAEDVMIAEVGYWENLLDTDPGERKKTREAMVNALALADELGARCAVNILGSYCHGNGNSSHSAANFTQDAFDEAVEVARQIIDSVKPKTASFSYEIFPFNVVDSPVAIEKLLNAVDRRQFGVHLDLVNLINCPRAYWTSADIMRECVQRFGNRIVSAHAKDIQMREPAISVILREVLPGQGNLDIAANLRELNNLPQEIPYMMEHLPDEKTYDLAAEHIRTVAAQEGITI
jgi:sugar phosphate isomerase/epimerase|tara:strand:+ start:193 stop:1053 length:861 start_codon:yes stop_codon:yes gene_type:complete